MRRKTITLGSATVSAAFPMNSKARNFQIGIGCVISGGAVLTYKVQHTFDDVFNSAVTPIWFDHSVITGMTTNKDSNYAFPITAVRLNVTAWTSGTVGATFLQAS